MCMFIFILLKQEVALPNTKYIILTVVEMKILKKESNKFKNWTKVFKAIVAKYFDEETLRM